jgi:hypothetical protein
MECPTCDGGTMRQIGCKPESPMLSGGIVTAGRSVMWCQRCGTVSSEHSDHQVPDVAKSLIRLGKALHDKRCAGEDSD